MHLLKVINILDVVVVVFAGGTNIIISMNGLLAWLLAYKSKFGWFLTSKTGNPLLSQ